MMKPKFYKKNKHPVLDIDENFNFVEEVPENVVEEYEFDDPNEDKRYNILIGIIFFLAIAIFGGGLYYAFIRPDQTKIINLESGDIFVVHSSVDFGDTIESFINYNSLDSAFEYTFYVENENEKDMNYNVKIIDKNIVGKSKIDKENVNYQLLKNKEESAKDKLSNIKNDILLKTTIKGSSRDYYVLKLWSDIPTTKYLKFEVEITEWEK